MNRDRGIVVRLRHNEDARLRDKICSFASAWSSFSWVVVSLVLGNWLVRVSAATIIIYNIHSQYINIDLSLSIYSRTSDAL